jgi:hypothetical protein
MSRGGAVAIGFLIALLACSRPGPAQEPADLVFRNGGVYTLDASRSWREAVAVRGGRIVSVGTNAQIAPFLGPATRVVDLAGRLLLPGFQDSHLHPGGGLDLAKVRLHSVFDREEVFRRISAWAAAHPGAEWVEGRGWEAGAFKPAGVPTRQMLDVLVAERPAWLTASDGHTGWANSQALALAGIGRETPDPPNGVIGRDPVSGEPTGILQEAAMDLVTRHIPPPTDAERLDGYRATLAELRRLGITGFVDAGASPQAERAYATLRDAGELSAHARLCQAYDPERDDDEQVAAFRARRAALTGGALGADCVKLMLDGIIEQHTGSLLEPYLDRPGDRGPLFVGRERLQRLVIRLDREGFQIHIHALADRAVREAVDALEAARRANGARDARPCLAHVQLIHPDDIGRLQALGIAANMTPIWARGDDLNVLFAEPRLGPERSRFLYAHDTLLGAGVRLVWGTDWPVTSLSPLDGLETAVTRRYLGGRDPESELDSAWHPAERLSLEQALGAYTIAGAWLAHDEDQRGSIEVGKRADLVVLHENLFEVAPLAIHEVPVDMTVFGGAVVFERSGYAER